MAGRDAARRPHLPAGAGAGRTLIAAQPRRRRTLTLSPSLSPEALAALTGGCGRGFTVLCTVPHAGLLAALAAVVGPTGAVLAAGPAPPHTPAAAWAPLRCDPAAALPLRSHIVDAAVLGPAPDLPRLAEEVRRALVPGGDVRLLLPPDATDSDAGDAAAALTAAAIRPLATTPPGVLLARGP